MEDIHERSGLNEHGCNPDTVNWITLKGQVSRTSARTIFMSSIFIQWSIIPELVGGCGGIHVY